MRPVTLPPTTRKNFPHANEWLICPVSTVLFTCCWQNGHWYRRICLPFFAVTSGSGAWFLVAGCACGGSLDFHRFTVREKYQEAIIVGFLITLPSLLKGCPPKKNLIYRFLLHWVPPITKLKFLKSWPHIVYNAHQWQLLTPRASTSWRIPTIWNPNHIAVRYYHVVNQVITLLYITSIVTFHSL